MTQLKKSLLKDRLHHAYRFMTSPFRLMGRNTGSIIKFELLYKIVTFLIFFPILGWVQRLLLVVNNTRIVAAYNLKSVKSNPLTYLVLLLMILLLTIFAAFERFAIVDALHASKMGLRRSAADMFVTGFDLTVKNFRPRNWLLIPYFTLILHFGSVSDMSSVTSIINIPGYLREQMEKYPYQKYLYYAAIVICFYLMVRWLFAIPIMMEEDNTHFTKACIQSHRMLKGRYALRAWIIVMYWSGLALGLFYVGTGAVIVVWYVILFWLTSGHITNLPKFMVQTFEGTSLILFLAFLWFVMPFLLASVQSLYYERKRALKQPVMPYTEEKGYCRKNKFVRYGFIGTAVICVFFSAPNRYRQIAWMMNSNMGTPLVMAHRGFSGIAPENTMPAFEKAIDAGFTAAELDVQMTKDGVIVVLHDRNLKRVTGVNKNIWDVTYDEIKDLDAGSHFASRYKGTPIPTLDEVLKLCHGKLFLNIEIKRTGHDDGIVEKVVKLIEENDYLDECDITSQDYSTLEEVRECSNVLTAYTSVIGMGAIQKLDAADIISIQETFATFSNIEKIRNAGKRIFVWTVNEEDTLETLVSLNVDAIITNNPRMCQKVIDKYSSNVINVVRRIHHALTYLG